MTKPCQTVKQVARRPLYKGKQSVNDNARDGAPQKRLRLRRDNYHAKRGNQGNPRRPQPCIEHPRHKQIVSDQSGERSRRNEPKRTLEHRRKLATLQQEQRKNATRQHGDAARSQNDPELRPCHRITFASLTILASRQRAYAIAAATPMSAPIKIAGPVSPAILQTHTPSIDATNATTLADVMR